MAIGPRLDLRQSQSLVMTPQLQQAIKLLQLSNLELQDYVEQELKENPLLEADSSTVTEAGEVRAEGIDEIASDAKPDAEPLPETTDTAETLARAAETGENVDAGQSMDSDVDNDWSSDTPGDAVAPAPESQAYESYGSGGGGGGGAGGGGDDLPGLEQTLASEETMREHLLTELGFLVCTAGDRLIGAHLIDMLDEAGYLQGSLEGLAVRLGCDIEDIEAVLGVLQTVEPTGLFARDLAQCLGLQLKERGRLDPIMQIFLENLDLLAKRDLPGLIKVCGVDEEDIQDMVTEIRELDPKPGRLFNHEIAQPMIPDVMMRAKPDGGWAIELNSETLPKVLVNNTYYAEIKGGAMSKDDRRYIQDCLQTANWLVKSLHQRATTILKVATEIVSQQDAFFREGVSALKPLVLRDVADVIEMHESTVSRVTSNKYMATPRGIFELKYFFTSSVGGSAGGDGHSSESVRQRIKILINEEEPKKVLSDDKIVKLLKAEGMDVARRTVAKYRDSLGLASSVQRRREKTSKI
ncbi:MAG: RNA polymerase sigma-54 factor [Rhodospirillaceae bacterium]|nr:MAG: RNA polymerase sigma-54 factor [Rhodospirillaceae bacterium]